MPRALVTGATGFVGSNLVAELIARGWSVRCLVRDLNRAAPLARLGAELTTGSLQDFDSIVRGTAGTDVVFHVAGRTAAIRRQDFFLDNVDGTRAVMKAAAEQPTPPTVVFVSSLAAGGPSIAGTPRRESDQGTPVSAYGASKLAAEQAATEFADRVPLSIVRPPVVFGPADRNSLQLFKTVIAMRVHLVPGFRTMPMSIVHVADLCAGLIEIAQHGSRVTIANPSQGIYYITSGPTITYAEMGRLAARAMDRGVLVMPTPKTIFRIVGGAGEIIGRIRRQPGLINWDKMREATASGWECSDEKLRSELNYNPPLSIEQRFIDTATWYRNHKWL
jgi:dihydroflavonol-4-reductase